MRGKFFPLATARVRIIFLTYRLSKQGMYRHLEKDQAKVASSSETCALFSAVLIVFGKGTSQYVSVNVMHAVGQRGIRIEN
jgi:hypothetical protein